MKNQIKELRIQIDALHQLTLLLMPVTKEVHYKFSNSQEIEDAAHSLIYAKAWLGKCMAELGDKTPYANDGKRKSVEDIELPTDVATGGRDTFTQVIDWDSTNHVERVDWIRTEIQAIFDKLENIEGEVDESVNTKPNSKLERYTNISLQYLAEARFALGFELGRVKASLLSTPPQLVQVD
jgi:hypothetical protein